MSSRGCLSACGFRVTSPSHPLRGDSEIDPVRLIIYGDSTGKELATATAPEEGQRIQSAAGKTGVGSPVLDDGMMTSYGPSWVVGTLLR